MGLAKAPPATRCGSIWACCCSDSVSFVTVLFAFLHPERLDPRIVMSSAKCSIYHCCSDMYFFAKFHGNSCILNARIREFVFGYCVLSMFLHSGQRNSALGDSASHRKLRYPLDRHFLRVLTQKLRQYPWKLCVWNAGMQSIGESVFDRCRHSQAWETVRNSNCAHFDVSKMLL